MKSSRRGGAVWVFVALSLQACAAGGGPEVGTTASPGRSSDLTELEALYRARADSARMDVSEADIHFVQHMIAHHAQALLMAGLAPERAATDALRTLAARTINAQTDEIASMRAWLEERGQVVPEIRISGTTLSIDGAVPREAMATMPGMLSAEQLRELAAARGETFDRLFLTYMIQHHEGAVAMVHELFATDGAAQGLAVFRLASDIQVDQTTEVRRMEMMLEALTDGR